MRAVLTATLLCCSLLAAAGVQVKDVRVWPSPESTRVVLDLSAAPSYKVFELANPERVVIDVQDAHLAANLSTIRWHNTPVTTMRSSTRDGGVRLVMDLRRSVMVKSFTLLPNQTYGHRLVIDLAEQSTKPTLARTQVPHKRHFVVAIDPGHGGEDPGAIGKKGTREKDVVLAIAKELAHRVNAEPGMKAVMTRDGDYYVGLRKRMEKARSHQADLFVSIHADGFNDSRAHGASVYTLSEKGASSEAARWLAESENRSDLIGGVKLGGRDDVLASVLLDLSQTVSQEASLEFAREVLGELAQLGKLHNVRVQQAGFAVLKSPDVPSILVETEFISNPESELKLRSKAYQQQVAKALLSGIQQHYVRHHHDVHWVSHQVVAGDNLSKIARQYAVSIRRICEFNDLPNTQLRVGQELKIPTFDTASANAH